MLGLLEEEIKKKKTKSGHRY